MLLLFVLMSKLLLLLLVFASIFYLVPKVSLLDKQTRPSVSK